MGEAGKKTLKAFALDAFLWSYTLLALHGVVYEKLVLDLRHVEFTWDRPLWAMAIGCPVALALFFTTASVGKAAYGIHRFREDETLWRKPFALFVYLVILVTFAAGFVISQISLREFLSPPGLMGARRIFGALLNPNFAILEDAIFAAVETIYMAFMATTAALPFAFLLGFFAARNLTSGSLPLRGVYNVCRFCLNVTRSIEPLVWAIIFSVWVGIGPFAGMLALWLHSISSLAKLYSEQIENIGDGPIEAMTATGAHPVQVIWFGVVPQIVLPYLSFTIYRWDINVRMATVIGLVGGGGIGTMLMQYQGLAKWNEVGLLAITIAVIVWMMDYASSKIRAHLK